MKKGNKIASKSQPKRQSAKRRAELDPKEVEAFFNRPIRKLEDLDRNLRKSYG